MEFEFDLRKSEKNRDRHGIDFVEARLLWEDPERIEIPARTEDEPRSLVIGKIGENCWSAIITPRRGKVRIISVSRSRKEEVKLYEGEGPG
jgi:uncharacterized protein